MRFGPLAIHREVDSLAHTKKFTNEIDALLLGKSRDCTDSRFGSVSTVPKLRSDRQFGNSVPPPLAQVVAMEIAWAPNVCLEQPETEVRLGNTNLLSMNMADAARNWSVAVPIAGQDRKSGSRKRTL